MATRQELQTKLEEILGCRHVYFQPPESTKMEYPAIVYSMKDRRITYADDTVYSMNNTYELIVIGRLSNDDLISKLLSLPYCTYERQYKSDNLYHDVLNLYF